MNIPNDQRKNYTVTFLLGIIGGGILVSLVTRAVPRMMTQMMSGMMQNMMSHMSESGCDPAEM